MQASASPAAPRLRPAAAAAPSMAYWGMSPAMCFTTFHLSLSLPLLKWLGFRLFRCPTNLTSTAPGGSAAGSGGRGAEEVSQHFTCTCPAAPLDSGRASCKPARSDCFVAAGQQHLERPHVVCGVVGGRSRGAGAGLLHGHTCVILLVRSCCKAWGTGTCRQS